MTEMMTPDQAKQEIERLLDSVGMSRWELDIKGQNWELDADQRGVLADVEGLEFLLDRAQHLAEVEARRA